MCVSLAACGKSDESGEKDDTEEKMTTTAAESVSEETESKAEAAESEAETEATTTAENAEESSAGEAAETSEADTEESADDISFTELEPFFTEVAGKDIDTAETILRDTLIITSEREDIESATGNIFHHFNLPDDVTICGVDFDYISLITKDDTMIDCSLVKEYESYPNTAREDANAIKDKLDNIGYTEISDDQDERRIANYNTDYGHVDITLLDKSILVTVELN